jgi:hypothetical protein
MATAREPAVSARTTTDAEPPSLTVTADLARNPSPRTVRSRMSCWIWGWVPVPTWAAAPRRPVEDVSDTCTRPDDVVVTEESGTAAGSVAGAVGAAVSVAAGGRDCAVSEAPGLLALRLGDAVLVTEVGAEDGFAVDEGALEDPGVEEPAGTTVGSHRTSRPAAVPP